MATKKATKKPKDDWDTWLDRIFDRNGLANATAEMKKNTREMLSAFGNKFDFVTREEFKAQQELLAVSAKRLAAIEKKLGIAPAAKKPAKRKKAAKAASKKKQG